MYKTQETHKTRALAAYHTSASLAGALPEDMDNALAEWRHELRLSIRRQNAGGPAVDWQKSLEEFNEICRGELMPEF